MDTVKKILIIEDEQYLRDLYAQILQDAGYSIDTAGDGEEGWKKASAGGYDLVLIDIIMPKLDGITLLKRLKQNPPAIPNKKTVMLTVLREDKYIKDALANGADGYLMKSSLTPDHILTKATNILNNLK